MRLRSWFLVLGSWLLVVISPAKALGPHEVVLLINERSPDSVEVGRIYARLRHIPEQNVIGLRIPASLTKPPSHMTRKEFTSMIWNPATRIIRERGISDHVLAWVYSVDFPIAVKTSPMLSIHGLTFTRDRVPDLKKVAAGKLVSELFADSTAPGQRGHYPQTFDVYQRWLGADLPLPSMMLGYTQEQGNTKSEVIKCLERGTLSDHTSPTGMVYFVQTDNVRSTCRHWQFPTTRAELRTLRIPCTIMTTFPIDRTDVLGLMIGAPWAQPERNKRYVPGSMAEHLTSAAAIFHSKDQTKLSAWIRAGCTASAGTVVEPYALWTKFPHARFYVHYASGCTMLESFYLSIRCPMQILLIGDPLARPWEPKGTVTLTGITEAIGSKPFTISVEATSDAPVIYSRFMFLLDGKMLQNGPGKVLELDPSKLKNGGHSLRVVAYSTGLVRHQAFDEALFTTKR